MTIAAQRTDLYNVVNGVTDAGVVHDYERLATRWPDFLEKFKTTISGTDQIRGWDVAYRGEEPTEPMTMGETGGAYHRVHMWHVHGYLGVDDSEATEKTAANLAEDVCDALDADSTLHGTTYYHVSKASMPTFEPRDFGGVLCHYILIQIEIAERET